ncbi:[LysW]-aminoadipate/[LysW]-glutamate kinase [uncultured archaeon]|nr:[LysW]-aminoadipate/[LysW]-glutamate kinase [uncultured archaeon]
METTKLLVEALEYVQRFNGQLFVIKLGGEVMGEKAILDSIARDLILLNLVGIKTVVLHGGGPEISEMMEKLGKKPKFIRGLRVTDEETMDIVKMVLVGKVNTSFVASINRHGGQAVGIAGKSGNLLIAEKKNEDLGFVGDISKINPHVLHVLVDKGYIPVVSPIAADKKGNSININADTAAGELAVALKASKIIILTNVPGVLDKDKKLIKRLTVPDIKNLEKDGTIAGGMLPKVEACVIALKGGVERAHIVQGGKHALLREILTREGTGTMITPKKVVGE